MSTNNNNAIIVDDCNKRIAGIKKFITDPNTAIPADGKVCSPAIFIAVFQEDIDARATVEATRAQLKAQIAVRVTKDAQRRVYDKALKGWVASRFGPHSTEAHELGYPPPKSATKSVATKSAALDKSKATRAARHTMGAKQKAELKGTKTVIISPEEAAAIAAAKAGTAPASGPATAPADAGKPAGTAPAAAPAAPPAPAGGTNGAQAPTNGVTTHP